MKKVIIILILVVYVASLALINLFFKPIGLSETNVYYKTISIKTLFLGNGDELTEPNSIIEGEELPVYEFVFMPNAEDTERGFYTSEQNSPELNPNHAVVQIDYTTTSDVEFAKPSNQQLNVYSNDKKDFYACVVNENEERTIFFYRPGAVIVTLEADDAQKASFSFWLICVDPEYA